MGKCADSKASGDSLMTSQARGQLRILSKDPQGDVWMVVASIKMLEHPSYFFLEGIPRESCLGSHVTTGRRRGLRYSVSLVKVAV